MIFSNKTSVNVKLETPSLIIIVKLNSYRFKEKKGG